MADDMDIFADLPSFQKPEQQESVSMDDFADLPSFKQKPSPAPTPESAGMEVFADLPSFQQKPTPQLDAIRETNRKGIASIFPEKKPISDMTATLADVQARDVPYQQKLERMRAMEPESPETMVAEYFPNVPAVDPRQTEFEQQLKNVDVATEQMFKTAAKPLYNAVAFLDAAVPMPENWRAAMAGMTPEERQQILSLGAPETVKEKIISGVFSGAGMTLGMALPGSAAKKVVGLTKMASVAPKVARVAESGLGFMFYGGANLPTTASLEERARTGAWDAVVGAAFGANSLLSSASNIGKAMSVPIAMGIGAATAGKGALPEDRWAAAVTLGIMHAASMATSAPEAKRMAVDEIKAAYGDKYGALAEKTASLIPDAIIEKAIPPKPAPTGETPQQVLLRGQKTMQRAGVLQRAGEIGAEMAGKPLSQPTGTESRPPTPRTGPPPVAAPVEAPKAAAGIPSRNIDLEAKAAAKGKEGAVTIPAMKPIKDWFKAKFRTDRGLGSELHGVIRKWENESSAAMQNAKVTKREFQIARNELGRVHGRDVVQDNIKQVLEGSQTSADFATKMGIAPTHPVVKMLDTFRADVDAKGKAIGDILEKTNAPAALVQKLKDSKNYLTRFYEAHIMGEEFRPDPANVQAAQGKIAQSMDEVIDAISKRASKFQKAVPTAQVADYLNSGGAANHLRGLTPEQTVELDAIGKQYSKMQQVLNGSMRTGDTITFQKNAKAFDDAVKSTVQKYLDATSEKGSGGSVLETSGLQKRHLDQIFRDLYGEITDPVFTAARTAEVQGKMLANQTFFNRVFEHGKDKWWSDMPSLDRGTTKQLANDPKKFGTLAGKYVSPELHKVITGGEQPQKIFQAYYQMKGTMRLMKLYGPKTVIRNALTSYFGFALGSGDVLRPGYHKNLREAYMLARRAEGGDPKAMRELVELAKLDVFRTTANSMVDDINRTLTGLPKGKIKSVLTALGERYSYIDLPTKLASYKTRLAELQKQNPTAPIEDLKAEAAEHVRKFYQHPDSLPQFVRDTSKMPLGDYPGYWVDAARISGNQVAHAVRSAAKGDLVPLIGFGLSRAISLGVASGIATTTWNEIKKRWMADDPNVKSMKDLPQDEQVALRSFIPEYYRDTPIKAVRQTDKNGDQYIVYTVTGGQGAFPAEDMVMAALQQTWGDDLSKMPQIVSRRFVQERVKPGMLESLAWKTIFGDELLGSFKSKGMYDAINEDLPDKNRIVAEALLGGAAEFAGGQVGTMARQAYAASKKRPDDVAGSQVTRKSPADVALGQLQLVKTYKLDKPMMDKSIRNKLMQFKNALDQSESQIRKGQDPEFYQRERLQTLKEIEGLMQNAKVATRGWYNDQELTALAKTTGLSQQEAMSVVDGTVDKTVQEYKPAAHRPNAIEKLRL